MSWRHILQLLLSHPVIKKDEKQHDFRYFSYRCDKTKITQQKQASKTLKEGPLHSCQYSPINNNNNYNSSSDNNYVQYFTLDFPWGNSPCPLFPSKTGILVFLVERKPVDPKINLWSTGKNWWQTQPRPEGYKASTLITVWGELRYW